MSDKDNSDHARLVEAYRLVIQDQAEQIQSLRRQIQSLRSNITDRNPPDIRNYQVGNNKVTEWMGWQKEIIPMLVKNGKMSTTAIRKELEKIHSIGCDNRQSSARLREALLRLERAGHVTYTYESGVATTAIWSLTEKLQSNLWESTQ